MSLKLLVVCIGLGLGASMVKAGARDMEFNWNAPSHAGACIMYSATLTLHNDGSASWRALVESIDSNNAYCVTLTFLSNDSRTLFTWPRFCSPTLWRSAQWWTNNNLAYPRQHLPPAGSLAIVSRQDHC